MIPAEPLRSRFCCLLVVNDLAPYSLIFLLHGSYAFSTFDTDYVLVKSRDLAAAVKALERAGHQVKT